MKQPQILGEFVEEHLEVLLNYPNKKDSATDVQSHFSRAVTHVTSKLDN